MNDAISSSPLIRPMTMADYHAVYAIWSGMAGIDLGDDDSAVNIARYLERNPHTCFVASLNQDIIAAVLCGHDGRRAILRHLAVKQAYRHHGIARALVQHCFTALRHEGISKCNLFVLDSNPAGAAFWQKQGWYYLADHYKTMQQTLITS